jgi:uncharacterized protein DUF4434
MIKKITGTFLDEISWDIPSANWGAAEWKKEFDTMKKSGIDTVIIIRTGLRDMSIYPSEVLNLKDEPDLAKFFLDEAERCGMKLFMGTYVNTSSTDFLDKWEYDWEINKKTIPEVLERYGDHPAFHGWYISSETCIATSGAIETFTRYSDLMKQLTPEKPVLISPYYPSWAYKDDVPEDRHRKFIEDWRRIFSKAQSIDICAFQDGSCTWEHDKPQTFELDLYLREVYELTREFNIENWTNIETFGRRYPIKFPPIDWRLLKKKMKMANPYSEKFITFEFSHFLSPNSMYPSARNLYKRYMEDISGDRSE